MVKRSREDSFTSSSSSTASLPTDASSHTKKYTQVVDEPPPTEVMQCSLPPHQPISFSTYADYEVHYSQLHTNRCTECRKNFPTDHFLNLHIGENHDPLNEALRAKGEKTYHCFLPDCDKVCSAPQKRRMHLIDKHTFPKNYDFLVINTGIDKRTSMLRTPRPSHHRRHSSAASRSMYRDRRTPLSPSSAPTNPGSSDGAPMETEPEETHEREGAPSASSGSTATPTSPKGHGLAVTDEMDALTSDMSALKFVPPSVRFGRGGRRGGLAKS